MDDISLGVEVVSRLALWPRAPTTRPASDLMVEDSIVSKVRGFRETTCSTGSNRQVWPIEEKRSLRRNTLTPVHSTHLEGMQRQLPPIPWPRRTASSAFVSIVCDSPTPARTTTPSEHELASWRPRLLSSRPRVQTPAGLNSGSFRGDKPPFVFAFR